MAEHSPSQRVTAGLDQATPLQGRNLQVLPLQENGVTLSAVKTPDGSVRLSFRGGTNPGTDAAVSIDGITNLGPDETIRLGLQLINYAKADQACAGSIKVFASRAPVLNEAEHTPEELIAELQPSELVSKGWRSIEVQTPSRMRPRALTIMITNVGSAELQLAPAHTERARLVQPKSALRENVESIVWAVTIALVIRTFIVAPFKIPSGSMRPTLIEGDRILVSKFTYRFREPRQADIVVFRYPMEPKRPFIKRLAAVGGEQVEIRDGHVLDNGQASESLVMEQIHYINQGQYGQQVSPVLVPAGMYFVLGDNSPSSHDSRFWGFVPRRLMIGKALCIFWPPNRIRILR